MRETKEQHFTLKVADLWYEPDKTDYPGILVPVDSYWFKVTVIAATFVHGKWGHEEWFSAVILSFVVPIKGELELHRFCLAENAADVPPPHKAMLPVFIDRVSYAVVQIL